MSNTLEDTDDGAAAAVKPCYVLRLYITGATPRSALALANVRKICEEHLKGCYALEIIDISLRPELADGEQIIAVPMLIKQFPLPMRRFFGEMSNTQNILTALDLREAAVKLSANGTS
jgi:circadian clock protein KaiB